jgi:hypothetical protein
MDSESWVKQDLIMELFRVMLRGRNSYNRKMLPRYFLQFNLHTTISLILLRHNTVPIKVGAIKIFLLYHPISALFIFCALG